MDNRRVAVKTPTYDESVEGVITVTVMGVVLDVSVALVYTVTSPYLPAQTYGDPNDCYPAEGPEFEMADLFQVSFGILEVDRDLWHEACVSDCTEAELKQLEELIFKDIADNA